MPFYDPESALNVIYSTCFKWMTIYLHFHTLKFCKDTEAFIESPGTDSTVSINGNAFQ
jgi:hypothetical protein